MHRRSGEIRKLSSRRQLINTLWGANNDVIMDVFPYISRKRHPFDNGRTMDVISSGHKFPKRQPTQQEKRHAIENQ
jgi:hypothetical protein